METVTPGKVAVVLNPVPGFCVKSRATNDTELHSITLDQPLDVHVTNGLKIFVNIAWDQRIPPPPPASDDAIHGAVQGLDDSDPEGWFVPIVLSDARQDSDKAGHPAIVFDCVLNPSIKSRTLREPDFKRFIIELAFQRIEAQTPLVLSREIGTPNIASKGKPQSRRVLIPTSLYPRGHRNHRAPPTLVQEVPDRSTSIYDQAPPKSILKNSSETRIPTWSWTQQGSNVRIVFDVPGVTHAVIPECTLEVEPRRVLLHVPALYALDLDLDAPDSAFSSSEAVRLKQVPGLDVDNARAEWRVADRAIVLLA